MDRVNQDRLRQREQALRTGLNPPGGYAAIEETKGNRYSGQATGVQSLNNVAIMQLDRMIKSGYDLPEVLTNESIYEEGLHSL